jgi:hypothetical protein
MTISGFEALFYTLAFVVPGFLLHSTIAVFVPRKAEQPQLSLLRFLSLSCANYALWSWLIYLISATAFFKDHPARAAIAWGIVILLSPIALGMLGGFLSQNNLVRKLLQRCGLVPMHAIPTAWDFRFSKIEKAVWVLVTLKDGGQVAGLFGSRSFASSDPSERDLYIQSVFRVPGEGQWQRVPGNDGVLISGDQIKYIEFWTDEMENKNG